MLGGVAKEADLVEGSRPVALCRPPGHEGTGPRRSEGAKLRAAPHRVSRAASDAALVSKDALFIGTKGMYEVSTGNVIMYAEPSANSFPLGVIRGGVCFCGTPISIGSGLLQKTWVRVFTQDVPPPMLCLTREAGLGLAHPHMPQSGVATMTLNLGNEVVGRGNTVNATNIQFVDVDRQFKISGSVTEVRFFVGYPSLQADLRFQVWRHAKGNMYRLVNETSAIACPSVGFQTYVLPEPMHVLRNDFAGWAHTGSGMLSYSDGGNSVRWKFGRQGVGATVDFAKGGHRTFSYEMTFHNASPGHMAYKCSSPSPTCYFDGMGTEDVIWVEYNDKKLTRKRDMTRGASETPAGFPHNRGVSKDSQLLTDIHWQKAVTTMRRRWPLNPEASSGRSAPNFKQCRLGSSTKESWSKLGPGAYVNFGRYGSQHCLADDNCGRWRQLGGGHMASFHNGMLPE